MRLDSYDFNNIIDEIENILPCACTTHYLAKYSKHFLLYNIYSISHEAFPTYGRRLRKKIVQFFCDPTLYITNVCRVTSCITKVALLNNFRTES